MLILYATGKYSHLSLLSFEVYFEVKPFEVTLKDFGVINETSEMVKSLVESEMNAVVKLKEKKIHPWNRNIKTFHYL